MAEPLFRFHHTDSTAEIVRKLNHNFDVAVGSPDELPEGSYTAETPDEYDRRIAADRAEQQRRDDLDKQKKAAQDRANAPRPKIIGQRTVDDQPSTDPDPRYRQPAPSSGGGGATAPAFDI